MTLGHRFARLVVATGVSHKLQQCCISPNGCFTRWSECNHKEGACLPRSAPGLSKAALYFCEGEWNWIHALALASRLPSNRDKDSLLLVFSDLAKDAGLQESDAI